MTRLNQTSECSRQLLAEHHREIEEACRALLARTYGDDSLELINEYRRFEKAVLEHMAVEELAMLPAYERHARDGGARIREEHAEIRKSLLQIGIDLELHAVRAERLTQLVDQLRAHAARENAGMYQWAQTSLSPSSSRKLVRRLRQSLRSLARGPSERLAGMTEHTSDLDTLS